MWDSGTGVLYNQSGGIVPLRGMPYLPKLNFGKNNVSLNESPTALSNRRIKLSLRYSLFLLMGSIVSMIMCTNGVQDSLKKIPMLCKGMFYRIIPKNIPGNCSLLLFLESLLIGLKHKKGQKMSQQKPV